MCDGVAFDELRRSYYADRRGANEITLGNDKRLDSYVPGEEIVSRKHTQLAEVREGTAIGYLRELDRKYNPEQTVKDTPQNRAQIPGQVGHGILGAPILEVPPQRSPVPRAVLEEAERLGIAIRDSNGNVYELP